MPIDYEDIDPFEICMSALALGLVSDLTGEELWIACNIAENAGEFDTAIQASERLSEVVFNYYKEQK